MFHDVFNPVSSSYVLNATGVAPPTSPIQPESGKSPLLQRFHTMVTIFSTILDFITRIIVAIAVSALIIAVIVVVVCALVLVYRKKKKSKVSNNMV